MHYNAPVYELNFKWLSNESKATMNYRRGGKVGEKTLESLAMEDRLDRCLALNKQVKKMILSSEK